MRKMLKKIMEFLFLLFIFEVYLTTLCSFQVSESDGKMIFICKLLLGNSGLPH